MFTITQGKGFHLTFANGWTVSVQWGAGNYCDNYGSRDYAAPAPSSRTAEVAAWDADGTWLSFGSAYHTVEGYKTTDEVVNFIANIAGLPASLPMEEAKKYLAAQQETLRLTAG